MTKTTCSLQASNAILHPEETWTLSAITYIKKGCSYQPKMGKHQAMPEYVAVFITTNSPARSPLAPRPLPARSPPDPRPPPARTPPARPAPRALHAPPRTAAVRRRGLRHRTTLILTTKPKHSQSSGRNPTRQSPPARFASLAASQSAHSGKEHTDTRNRRPHSLAHASSLQQDSPLHHWQILFTLIQLFHTADRRCVCVQ